MNKESMKTFYLLWVTQGLSALGSSLSYFTIVVWFSSVVFAEHQNAELTLALTILSLVFTLPQIIASPIAGILVDKISRKRILWSADAIQGAITLIIAYIAYSESHQYWSILILLCVIALVSVFHNLAFNVSYIMIVPTEKLPRANALMQTLWTLTSAIGPALSALLISKWGISTLFLIDAVTFIISSISILFINIPSPKKKSNFAKKEKNRRMFSNEIRTGWKYLKFPPLLWLLGLQLIANFAFSTDVLIPVVVKHSTDWLKWGWNFESSFAFIDTLGFIGGTLGGFLAAYIGVFTKKRALGVLIPYIGISLALLAFGSSKALINGGIFYFVRMFLTTIAHTHISTIWQMTIPPSTQGRVFGLTRFIISALLPLQLSMVGFISSLTSPIVIYLVLGSAVSLYYLSIFLSSVFCTW